MENTFHIQWHITDFCNLRCRHCYQSAFKNDRELPFADVERIFRDIVDFAEKSGRKLVIDITGGEPFLYGKWHELISMIDDCETVVESGIITNGFFIERSVIERLEKLKKFRIKISAEGFSEETYEYFRGRGAYARFTDTCEILRHADFEKILMFTVFSGSIAEIEGIFSFMGKYGFAKTVIERFIPWGRGAAMRERVISVAEWKDILRMLCSKCGLDDEYLQEMVPYRGFMVEKDEGSFNLFGAPCIVARDGMALMPDGTVFPCRRFPLAAGNLIKESLEEIWQNSKLLKQLNKRILLKGKCKVCIIEGCLGCRAMAYSLTGDFLAEDPLCIMNE